MHVQLFPTWSCMSCSLLQTQLYRLFPCLNWSRTHLVVVCPVPALQRHQGRRFTKVNPLPPGFFGELKKPYFGISEIFRLNIGQISFNLVQKAFDAWQLEFLVTSIAFYDIFARAYVLRLFRRFFSFFLPFLSFCCSDWRSSGIASKW